MKIIFHNTDYKQYEPFEKAIENWFTAKKQNALPEYKKYLECEDGLVNYRMVATIKTDPLSVLYEDVASGIEKLYGKPIKNKNLDELYNDWFRKRAYEGYKATVENLLPVYQRCTFSSIVKNFGYCKIHFPFGINEIERIVSYIIPLDKKITRRKEWEKIVQETPWL